MKDKSKVSCLGLLGDIFGVGGVATGGYVAEKVTWLPAARGKGLEVAGTFSRRLVSQWRLFSVVHTLDIIML